MKGTRKIRLDFYVRDLLDDAERIAKKHGCTFNELVGRSQEPHVLEARRELYEHLQGLRWSLSAIGRLLGRDHSTIKNALAKEAPTTQKATPYRGGFAQGAACDAPGTNVRVVAALHCGRLGDCVRAGAPCRCPCTTCREARGEPASRSTARRQAAQRNKPAPTFDRGGHDA